MLTTKRLFWAGGIVPGQDVTVDVEYDDVTLDTTVFIINNPEGIHLLVTLTNPLGTVRQRDVQAVLNDFRYDPVMPVHLVAGTSPTGQPVLRWPEGWKLEFQVTA